MRYLSFIVFLLACTATAVAQPDAFVRVDYGGFKVDDRSFEFVGANAYWLQQQASYGNTTCIEEVLDAYVRRGIRVVRTWGFANGWDGWTHEADPAIIQARPGVLREHGLRALDYVVQEAKERDLRVIVVLVNNWNEFGGVDQYARWAAESGLIANSTVRGDPFYREESVRELYKDYVSALLNRTSTYSGVAYKDEPAIFGWELANEPRVRSDTSGQVLYEWLDEMSSFVRSIDPNHLIGTGEEGFDTVPVEYADAAYGGQTWLYDGHEGVSFSRNLTLPNVDYASIHLYPDHWLPDSLGASYLIDAGRSWIRDHLRMASRANKPLVLGEYGSQTNKAEAYSAWLAEAHGGSLRAGGSLVWDFVCPHRRSSSPFAFSDPDDGDVVDVLAEYAHRLNTQSGETATRAGETTAANRIVERISSYPSPFAVSTTVSFGLERGGSVRVDIYDVQGRQIARLSDGHRLAGNHSVEWSGRTSNGDSAVNGVYWIRVATDHRSESHPVVLTR